MKISITGANGQLGSRLAKLGAEPLSCDVTNRGEVESELRRVQPDVVIHLAAQTSVDWCEANERKAMTTNVYGTAVVCESASDILGEGKVVILSTDQVFNGLEGEYKEDSIPDPINVYGKTKQAAEEVASLYDCKVIRISRCFNAQSADIRSYLEDLSNGNIVYVPDFMYRSYIHTDFIASSIWEYANRFSEMPAVLHIAGRKSISFYELIVKISAYNDLNINLICPRGEEPNYVARPHRTGLNTDLAESLGFDLPFLGQSMMRLYYERL